MTEDGNPYDEITRDERRDYDPEPDDQPTLFDLWLEEQILEEELPDSRQKRNH